MENINSLNYPKPALMVIAYKKGINGKSKDAQEKLKKNAESAFSPGSREEFSLEMIANVTEKKLEDVIKEALSVNVPLSKNAEGKYYVMGEHLITLTNTEFFCGNNVIKDLVKPEKSVKKQEKKENEVETMPEETKPVVKETVEKKKEDKPKTGKALLKSILSGGSSMDIQRARKFLIDKKIKTPIEVALMSDPDVLKFATKDCVIFSIENEAGKCEIAISKDELKKIDISKVLIL